MKKLAILVFLWPVVFGGLVMLVSLLPVAFGGCEAIWHNGPTQLLRDIFKITEIENVDNLEYATKQANFRWIRPKGLERWDIYSILNDFQRSKLTKLIKNSTLAKVKMPTKRHYYAVVILGATTTRVSTRMEFLLKLAKHGVTWDKVFLLGSTRDLNTGPEPDQKMADFLKQRGDPQTEMAMMEYLWTQFNKPKFCQKIAAVSIQAGQRNDSTRANTEDILVKLAQELKDINDKNILFISNNPYICYQDAVVKRILKPYNIITETVGEAMSEESMENVLDTIARCLTNMS